MIRPAIRSAIRSVIRSAIRNNDNTQQFTGKLVSTSDAYVIKTSDGKILAVR